MARTHLAPLLLLPWLLAMGACSHAPAQTGSRVMLLGEVHDNDEGHAARLELLRARVAAGWRPAVAMEQFDVGQQPALDAAMASCPDAGCVVAKVVAPKSGWNWEFYRPVIALALEYQLPLLAANLSRGDASKVVKDGFAAALPDALIGRYALAALPATLMAAQQAEVRDSHCGMLPEAMVAPMARAQIARDVLMAETVRSHAASGVVLIAGNGHVRRDIGAPYWLRQQGIHDAWAIGFVEDAPAAKAFDAVERVARQQRPDPCAAMR